MPTDIQYYSQDSYNKTASHLNEIRQVSQVTGMTPQVIFGAMVEECHDHDASTFSRAANYLSDQYVLQNQQAYPRPYTHEEFKNFYQNTKNPNDIHGVYEKRDNPVLNDISSYNIKLHAAIRLIDKYSAQHPNDDPLNLKHYKQDYPSLAKDMVADKPVVVAVAGLALQEAKQYFDKNVTDKAWWNEQTQAYKDAVYVTFYNNGPKSIEKNRSATVSSGHDYHPSPGGEKSGGLNHLYNAEVITQFVGGSIDYNRSHHRLHALNDSVSPKLIESPQTFQPQTLAANAGVMDIINHAYAAATSDNPDQNFKLAMQDVSSTQYAADVKVEAKELTQTYEAQQAALQAAIEPPVISGPVMRL